jgi:hypothetical protein
MTSKPNSEWDAEEIKSLAQTSGKPLEVQVAQEFLKRNWSARLGTHYTEGADNTARELDVLAEWSRQSQALNATIRVRAMVSCRGFPEARSPLCYSVGRSVPAGKPRLLTKYLLHSQPRGASATYQTIPDLEQGMAISLLQSLDLTNSERIVSWDVVEREERIPKGSKTAEPVETYRRASDGDRAIFPALDSAISAAIEWISMDRNLLSSGYHITLHIPICVLSLPFWQISIDGGKLGEPRVSERAYQTNAYPHLGEYKDIMTVICAATQIADLVRALDEVANDFEYEAQRAP